MINRLFNYIFHTIVWQSLFRFISRMNFRLITNNFRAQLLATSILNLFQILRALIFNRDNFISRFLATAPGINPLELVDTKPKKAFWIGFVFTLILYRQYLFFKRLFLWPFKLGIFSFIFSLTGLDMSWILSWFNYFPLNIPQWVYIQYLTLYSNWLDWWKGTVQIKNLSTEAIPSLPKPKDNLELNESTTPENKLINKNNLLILAGVVTLIGIGIGVWYYFYSGSGGSAGGQTNINGGNIFYPNPPAPNPNEVPHTITISDNQTTVSQTDTSSAEPGTTYNPTDNNLIDRLNATEAWGSNPFSSTSDPWGSSEASTSISGITDRAPSPTGSTDSTETVTQSSIKADFDHYFHPKE